MNYKLELNELPFEAIKSGKKKVETRTKVPHNMTPYEEMRSGDTITFIKSSTGEEMVVMITEVSHYQDVATMLGSEGQENVMSYEASTEEAIKSYASLSGYPEGIKKYGIWAIKIKPLS